MPRENKVFQVNMRREAVDDLDEIRRFIQNDSFARARSFLSALKWKILGLKRFPHRGSRARLLGLNVKDPEIRFSEYKGYLMFYVVEGNVVTVLHVSGPGQDWMRLFL